MKRILTVDLGNTAAKATLFEDGAAVKSKVVPGNDPDALFGFASEMTPDFAVYCSVRGDNPQFGDRLRAWLDIPVEEVTSATRLPFALDYGSPGTLGVDRIAAAAGAIKQFGGNVMIVDAGTAVTTDIVEGDTFRGGNISPGLKLRFRSLHDFTGCLPLVSSDGDLPEFGTDTVSAIRTGVVRGLVAEIWADYNRASYIYKEIKLVLTGGDADFLAPLLSETGLKPMVCHDLVGLGLVYIIEHK